MATTAENFDIRKLRNPYESNAEWRMREVFLQAHRNKYPVHRLLCLSNCYINMEIHGSRYPDNVMREIHSLKAMLPKIETNREKGLQKMKFVKASTEPVKKDDASSSSTSKKKTTVEYKVGVAKASPPKPSGPQSAKNGTESTSSVTKPSSTTVSSTSVTSTSASSTTKSSKTSTVSSATSSVTANVSSTNASSSNKSSSTNNETKPTSFSFPPNYVPKRIAADWEPKNPSPVFNQKNEKPKVKSLKDAQRFNPDVVSTKFADFMMPIDQKFYTLAQTYHEMMKKDSTFRAMDILPIVGMKCKMLYSYKFVELPAPKGLHKFVCTMLCDNVEIGTGEGGNKKTSKKNAIAEAGDRLCKHYLKVARINPERQELQGSDEYFTSAWSLFENNTVENNAPIARESNAHILEQTKKRKFSQVHGDLSQFLIIEPLDPSPNDNARSILQRSADFNKALLEYEFHNDSTGVRCRLQLEGQTLVEFFGTTRASTKSVASEKALEGLRKMCWTIKIKQAVDSEDSGLARDNVLGDIQKQVESIPENNIGNQLLRKMGWTGGGVGAEGNKGKEEPVAVTLQHMVKREGLGMNSSSSMKNFREKVTEVIDNYAKSDKQEDLAFSAEFSKDERVFIHTYAQKLNLKTQSRGAGEERYLTLSRKRTPDQLFNHLMEEGGSTSKYQLVPPGQEGMHYSEEQV